MDVLADLLTRARARGAVFVHSTLRGAWGIDFSDEQPLSLHAVLEGELFVETDDEPAVRLLQGDLLLVRSDEPYRFVHQPGAAATPVADLESSIDGRRFEIDGPATVVVCGTYSFDGTICDSLLAAIPRVLPLHGVSSTEPSVRVALGLLAEELQREAPGQPAVLDRLLDLLLVYTLRAWFARADAQPPAWYGALDDAHVGAALRALHGDPSRAWSVAELAAVAGLSRAAFARRFTDATGQAPLGYLTEWRMVLATQALRRPGATLASVAREIGYGSEFAFANAFKRHHGVPPGRWRREHAVA